MRSSTSEQRIELRPWLYAIARSRCLSVLRARRERPAEPATEHPSAVVQRRKDLRDLPADVARLPDDQRPPLVLAEVGAMPHEEIATVRAAVPGHVAEGAPIVWISGTPAVASKEASRSRSTRRSEWTKHERHATRRTSRSNARSNGR